MKLSISKTTQYLILNKKNMAKFITTIELQGADEKDFEKLNNSLEKESFKGIHPLPLKSDDLHTLKGQCKRAGRITLQDVSRSVLKILSRTGKKYSFTIIKSKTLSKL